jgi:hypothetical protein
MSYTNATSSNWNPDFYSKQVGGDKCTMVCKKKCKKNCATYCQLAKSDEDVKETVRTLKEKRDKLKEKLKELEGKEKDYDQVRIRDLIRKSYYQDERDYFRKMLKKGEKGGTRRRKARKTRRGGNWFSNPASLAPCEKACSDKCEAGCSVVCSDAAYYANEGTELSSLKNEVKLLELTVDRLESKLNL